MAMSDYLLVVLVFLGALIGATLSLYCFRHRKAPGASYLSMFLLAAGWWSFFYGLELTTSDPALSDVWFSAGIVGNAWLAALALLFAMDYSGHPLARTRWFVCALGVEPILHIIIAHTNHLHRQMYSQATFEQFGILTLVNREWGPWFVIDETLGVVLVAAALLFLLRKTLGSPRVFRRQLLGVGAGLLLAVSLRVAMHLGHTPLQGFDVTHLSFVVVGSAMALSFFRFGMFDILPAARESVVEKMVDGIIVLDANGHCVDANLAARAFLTAPRRVIVGETAEMALLPEVFQSLQVFRTSGQPAQWTTADDRTYELQETSIFSAGGAGSGEVLVIRDVTRETETRRAQAEASRLAEENSRASREFLSNVSHELRTPLNLVLGFADALRHDPRAPLVDSQQEFVGEIEKASRDLLNLVNLVIGLTKVDTGKRPTVNVSFDLVEFCLELVENLDRKYGHPVVLHSPEHPVTVNSDMEITAEIISVVIDTTEENDGASTKRGLHVIEGNGGSPKDSAPLILVETSALSHQSAQFRQLVEAAAHGTESPADIDLRTWLHFRLASRLASHVGGRLEYRDATDATPAGIALVFGSSQDGT